MEKIYDCAIIGGGVAGLALSVLLAKAGKTVALFEKNEYPFHKVCGEYISNESLPFLNTLGINLTKQNLPQIENLLLTSPSGIAIKRKLDIGGVGFSRYELDNRLYNAALQAGAAVFTNTKVTEVVFKEGLFRLTAANKTYTARTTVGAYGKNSNIDNQLGRTYRSENENHLFVAVKHHIRTTFDTGCVEMHNFSGGYCGLSAIEDGKVNMSYITKAANLKKCGSIAAMEKQVLATNPFLKKYIEEAAFVFEKPLTISHLYFNIKQPVSSHILMTGDAAGNIAPLSGNGMSMALQSAKIAYKAILPYLNDQCSMQKMKADAIVRKPRLNRKRNSSPGGNPALR